MTLLVARAVHANVNCRDLERSLGFYRDIPGLAPTTHTRPPPQDGQAFGLEGRVRRDGWLLHHPRGAAVPGIDLLQWLAPAPSGRPAVEADRDPDGTCLELIERPGA